MFLRRAIFGHTYFVEKKNIPRQALRGEIQTIGETYLHDVKNVAGASNTNKHHRHLESYLS